MARRDRRDRLHLAGWIAAAVVAVAGIAGAAYWWGLQGRPAAPPRIATAPPPSDVPPQAAPAPALPASVAALPPVPEPVSREPVAAQTVADELIALLGKPAVLKLLQTDDFPRRLVATVDNLGRGHAPSQLWPVVPVGGRFAVVERNGRQVVSPDNATRYLPLVQLAEQVDPARAAALYVRLLPLLQQAYEELGFPGKRFHSRLVQVIDELLAAPQVPELVEVQLTEVHGPIAPERPWVRYEFVDPALERATAGQKMLMRTGATNERRLKARLLALRAELRRQAAGG